VNDGSIALLVGPPGASEDGGTEAFARLRFLEDFGLFGSFT
jgi:hypothetical protein